MPRIAILVVFAGLLLTLGCGGAAAPEVDPHQAAVEWFEDNQEYVAASVIAAILESNRALAVVDVEYLAEKYRAGVRTELRDVERVESGGEAVFNAVLWTLAEFSVDTDGASGSVEVDFPWGLTIQADDGSVEARPVVGDMDLQVSIEGGSVEVDFLADLIKFLRDNAWVADWLDVLIALVVLIAPICYLLWKTRRRLRTLISIVLGWMSGYTSRICCAIRYGIRRGHRKIVQIGVRINLHLVRTGVISMKLNLNAIPGVTRVWDDKYVKSDLSKAALLSSRMNSYLNNGNDEQRNRQIGSMVSTPAVRDLLVARTLDLEVFCALIVEYVIEAAARSPDNGRVSDDKINALPIPYSVIEPVIRDLIGEEKETEESDSGY